MNAYAGKNRRVVASDLGCENMKVSEYHTHVGPVSSAAGSWDLDEAVCVPDHPQKNDLASVWCVGAEAVTLEVVCHSNAAEMFVRSGLLTMNSSWNLRNKLDQNLIVQHVVYFSLHILLSFKSFLRAQANEGVPVTTTVVSLTP